MPTENETQGGGTTAASTPRPKPKRKFIFQIGGLRFEKRCTVSDMLKAANETPGVVVSIVVDGSDFMYHG